MLLYGRASGRSLSILGDHKPNWNAAVVLFLLCSTASIPVPGQTVTTLVNFRGPDGAYPGYGPLVQGIDGQLYGITEAGGDTNSGAVFSITPQGQLISVNSLNGADGADPLGRLVIIPNGMFYGTAFSGGDEGENGTVIGFNPNGTLTSLHVFDGTDGANPFAGLVWAFNGMLYGTTSHGGAYGEGTIFQITARGTLTTRYSFEATNGGDISGLLQAADRLLYGTTSLGGPSNAGTIYTMSLTGTFATLHTFNVTDGSEPFAALIQGRDGNFYGTTDSGGANNAGTVFQITPAGILTTLHSFSFSDGSYPFSALVQGTDENFYGTTSQGGADNCGVIFQISRSGAFTNLYSFGRPEGCTPRAGLVQDTNGSFYGTTWTGGSRKYGTVFKLSMGLGPFVRPLPFFGEVGEPVMILGTDLTGATSVTFNGTPASFTVQSPTAIKATVPSGATTGAIEVATPSGTVSSHAPFLVH
ncbi:MAG TPA: choice-of-anchor tandem repeat GloVer-containing protein [Bryobacteraceae bacterium]|nr:choice-of-anchor tandem repeat GloVer-containing protein [Bryobacteraceae bacterium]